MKKQMTPAEKAQYKALYWRQKVASYKGVPGEPMVNNEVFIDRNYPLSLRSIEQITDDELKVIHEILGFSYPPGKLFVHKWLDSLMGIHDGGNYVDSIKSCEALDTLRSISIATPFKHYSIQDLIDNNVLKFES